MHPSGGLAASSPYRGAFPAAAASNASPVRGGGCTAGADGGVPHLALQISFRTAAHPRPPAFVRQLALVRNRRVRIAQAPQDDAGGVPRGCRARFCLVLEDTPDTKRQCTPQAALPPAPLTGEPFPAATASNASPVRGGGCAAGADGGVPHLALQVSFRAVTHPRPPSRITSIPLPCLPLPCSTKNARRKNTAGIVSLVWFADH